MNVIFNQLSQEKEEKTFFIEDIRHTRYDGYGQISYHLTYRVKKARTDNYSILLKYNVRYVEKKQGEQKYTIIPYEKKVDMIGNEATNIYRTIDIVLPNYNGDVDFLPEEVLHESTTFEVKMNWL